MKIAIAFISGIVIGVVLGITLAQQTRPVPQVSQAPLPAELPEKAASYKGPLPPFVDVLLSPDSVIQKWLPRFQAAAHAETGSITEEELYGPCTIVRVIDGDTVDVNCEGQGRRVRLLNIDTPESDHPGYTAATLALTELLQGGALTRASFCFRRLRGGGAGASKPTAGNALPPPRLACS